MHLSPSTTIEPDETLDEDPDDLDSGSEEDERRTFHV
jgi:hypothetical protein